MGVGQYIPFFKACRMRTPSINLNNGDLGELQEYGLSHNLLITFITILRNFLIIILLLNTPILIIYSSTFYKNLNRFEGITFYNLFGNLIASFNVGGYNRYNQFYFESDLDKNLKGNVECQTGYISTLAKYTLFGLIDEKQSQADQIGFSAHIENNIVANFDDQFSQCYGKSKCDLDLTPSNLFNSQTKGKKFYLRIVCKDQYGSFLGLSIRKQYLNIVIFTIHLACYIILLLMIIYNGMVLKKVTNNFV